MQREIEKNPVVPTLPEEVVQLLTALCFREDDAVEKADLIFQFSTADETAKVAAIIKHLLANNISNKVFITGGMPVYEDAVKKNESKLVLDLFDKDNYKDVRFFSEETSGNTLGNITEALKVLDFLHYKTVLFICKSHAAGRCYATLRKFLPGAKLIQQSYDTRYAGAGKVLSKDTWHTFAFGKSRVWGEYLRLTHYSRKGDIYLDETSLTIISKIEQLLPDR